MNALKASEKREKSFSANYFPLKLESEQLFFAFYLSVDSLKGREVTSNVCFGNASKFRIQIDTRPFTKTETSRETLRRSSIMSEGTTRRRLTWEQRKIHHLEDLLDSF